MGGGNKNLVTLSQESQGSSRINLNVEQAFTLYLGQSVELPKFLFCRTSGEVGEASISQSNHKSSYFAEWAVKWAKPLSVSRMAKVVSLQNKWWGGRCLYQSVELQKLLFCRTSGEVGDASISQSNYKSCYLQNKWWGGWCLAAPQLPLQLCLLQHGGLHRQREGTRTLWYNISSAQIDCCIN